MWELIAQESTGGFGLETIIQLASAGGMGALSWYLIAKVLPEKDREHREERKADQLRWQDERGEFRAYIAARDAQWIEYLEKLDTQDDKRTRELMDLTIRLEALILEMRRGKPDAK